MIGHYTTGAVRDWGEQARSPISSFCGLGVVSLSVRVRFAMVMVGRAESCLGMHHATLPLR